MSSPMFLIIFADFFAVDRKRKRQVELVDHPVSGIVAHGAKQTVGHEGQRTVVVAQSHGSKRNMFHGAFGARPAFDVFANAEYVLDQEKHARDHISHQSLGTKFDRQAEYAGSREQRRDLNAERPERRKREERDKDDRQRSAKQRQQRQKTRILGWGTMVIDWC